MKLALPVLDEAEYRDFNTDIITHILTFSSQPTLCCATRVSKLWNELAVPILYRHLSVDFPTPNPVLFRPHPYTLPPNPNLQHTLSLRIGPHRPSQCSSVPALVQLPKLRSAQFHIDRFTYHGPSSCGVLDSLEPKPKRVILSAENDGDALYYAFGEKPYRKMPDNVEQIVILIPLHSDCKTFRRDGVSVEFDGRPLLTKELSPNNGTEKRREVILVFQAETRKAIWADSTGERAMAFLGAMATIGLLVATSLTIHGLIDERGEGATMEVLEQVLREEISEMLDSRGCVDDRQIRTEEVITRIVISDLPWRDL